MKTVIKMEWLKAMQNYLKDKNKDNYVGKICTDNLRFIEESKNNTRLLGSRVYSWIYQDICM